MFVRERARWNVRGRPSKFFWLLVHYRLRAGQGLVSAGTTGVFGLSSAPERHSRALLPRTAPSGSWRTRACASNELAAGSSFVRAAELGAAKYSNPRELEARRRLNRSSSSRSSNRANNIYIDQSRRVALHPEVQFSDKPSPASYCTRVQVQDCWLAHMPDVHFAQLHDVGGG